ncbi:DUF4393 domain-containing protein [Bradyrhizobium viridifuturi]|jgi:hypothetical protein|nr:MULTISPECIES: Abi-alpha family protein [Bradyrhizobium]ERF81438.1 MAG: hypothetical protein C207_05276 [Bradyrhizobium sp. DFCI-1]OYU60875.1 MAG: hypothetical protein CFE30_18260 [Bradyrhizobium sp. PARBB1]PSO28495.1 DUF4393 domain-containing protein [Bradyrhizobium sp. MOS004]QRI72604.1 DUF4393 domain-containing protein [Bradyrhizobium sp. PSBB068]MBR1021091.1 DUF4393 domain-containing protein [Bradyrhizobium viridifuturi]
MIDGPEPFGKETAKAAQELAKTADNAIDAARGAAEFLNRVLGNPIADVVGITVADPLRFVRIISLDWYSKRVDEILAKRNTPKPRGAPPRIALDILEAAQDETRDELKELWARLLANAMDATTQKNVRIEFITVLKQLNPLDALILQRLAAVGNFTSPNSFAQAQHLDSNDTATSVLYLLDLKCVEQAANGSFSFKLSPRGLSLLKALSI